MVLLKKSEFRRFVVKLIALTLVLDSSSSPSPPSHLVNDPDVLSEKEFRTCSVVASCVSNGEEDIVEGVAA